MLKKLIKSKSNNSGAALVSVVIVIAFVSILVTTVLYMAGMNFYAKGTDRMTKISFYDAEIGMERIKAQMMMQAKQAHYDAYPLVMAQGSLSEGEKRTIYNQAFAESIKDQYNTIQTTGTLENWLKTVAQDPYSYGLSCGNLDDSEEDEGKIYIRDVELSYNKDGYQTIIKTDFVIQAPDISWGVNGNPPDFSGATVADLKRKEIDMSDSVLYYNWKKE